MKQLVFTKHAQKRIDDRFPGFKTSDLERIFQSAEKTYTNKLGIDYYQSRAYTFIVKENKKSLTIITFYKT